jgi:PAS domain S-box-containing protein
MSDFQFVHLKEYAGFLLRHKLDQLTLKYYQLAYEANFPLLKIVEHLPDEEKIASFKAGLIPFLESFINNNALELSFDTIKKWKNNEIPNIPKEIVQVSDIVLNYGTRKKAIISFLPDFTQDISLALRIIEELESFQMEVEKYTIDVYTEIQNDLINQEKEFAKAIINSNVDCTIAFNQDLNITAWNNSIALRSGIHWERVKDKKITQQLTILKEEDLKKVLKGKKITYEKYNFDFLPGFYEIHVVPIELHNTISGGLVILFDITKRVKSEEALKEHKEELQSTNEELKESQEELQAANEELHEQLEQITQMQQALKESERKFRLVTENSSDLLATLGVDGTINYASPSCNQLLGFSPEEVIGKPFHEFIDNQDLSIVNEAYHKILIEGTNQIINARIKHKNGQSVWFEVKGNAIPTTNANFTHNIQITAREIHEKKLMGEALDKERKFVESIFKNASEGIMACDFNGNLTLFNHAAKELHGIPEGPIPANEWSNHYSLYCANQNTKINKEDTPLTRALQGTKIRDWELIVEPVSGKKKHLIVNGSQLVSSDGKLIGAVVIMHDVTARKKAEHKLIKNEALLSEAQAIAHIGSWEWNLSTDKIYWSDEMKRLFGYAKDHLELNLDNYLNLLLPEERPFVEETISKGLKDFKPFAFHHRIKLPDGTIRWIDARGKVILAKNGQPVKMAGTGQDITKQKEAELQVQEKQNLIEKITNTSPNVLYVFDLRTKANAYVNKKIEEYLGYTPEQIRIMGEHALNTLLHPEDVPKYRKHLDTIQHIKTGEVLDIEYRVKHATGSWRWFRSLETAFKKDNKDNIIQIVGTAQDITIQKNAEEAILYREAQLIEAQQLAHVGSLDWDVLSGTITCTPEFNKIFNIPASKDSITYDELIEKIHPEDREKVNQGILEAFKKSRPFETEYRIGENGNTKTISAKGKAHFNDNGVLIRFTSTALDITQRIIYEQELQKKNHDLANAYIKLESAQKNLQQINNELEQRVRERTEELSKKNLELNKKNKELQTINVDLDNFIYTASHDLKTPIANLEGLTRVLNTKLVPSKNSQEEKILQMMETSIIKFKNTINDLTEITKVQKEINEEIERIRFEDLLDPILTDLQPMVEENKAIVDIDFQVKQINYARKNLRSIIYNLITNALKYRSPDRAPHIQIKTRQENNYILLTVQDNGLGIRKDQLPKLFNMFKRLHTHVEGTGIGLYIIKRIIENNGGKIEVESEPNVGTVFKVFFKLA